MMSYDVLSIRSKRLVWKAGQIPKCYYLNSISLNYNESQQLKVYIEDGSVKFLFLAEYFMVSNFVFRIIVNSMNVFNVNIHILNILM